MKTTLCAFMLTHLPRATFKWYTRKYQLLQWILVWSVSSDLHICISVPFLGISTWMNGNCQIQNTSKWTPQFSTERRVDLLSGIPQELHYSSSYWDSNLRGIRLLISPHLQTLKALSKLWMFIPHIISNTLFSLSKASAQLTSSEHHACFCKWFPKGCHLFWSMKLITFQ